MNGQTLVNAFVKLPGGARAVYNSTGLSYYRHADYLGSSRLATTPSRTKYYDVAYAPYGEDYNGSGTQDLAFTGQTTDTVSGSSSSNLYDFLMREYRAAHGRWISPDPAGLAAVNSAAPQSWNRYSYVMNNPVVMFDPLGLKVCPMLAPDDIDKCGDGKGGDAGDGGGSIFGGWGGYIFIPDYDREGTLVGYIPQLLWGDGALGGAGNIGTPCLAGAGPLAVGQSRCGADNGSMLILTSESDCPDPNGNGRNINYTLKDTSGNPVSGYTVVEHQTDTSRTSSAFGPGTSYQVAPPGTPSGFDDWLNPGPFQTPGNSIQTFTATTASPSPSAPQQPVTIQSVNGQMNGSLGIWFQFPQVFVNGVPTPTQCVFANSHE